MLALAEALFESAAADFAQDLVLEDLVGVEQLSHEVKHRLIMLKNIAERGFDPPTFEL